MQEHKRNRGQTRRGIRRAVAVFRGTNTHPQRILLAELAASGRVPGVDAGITGNVGNGERGELRYTGNLSRHMRFDTQAAIYKYVIMIDGHGCAARLPTLLLSNMVVLWPRGTQHEWWYHELQPWQHYVPIEIDAVNLTATLKWLHRHDAQARHIAVSAAKFVRQRLSKRRIQCAMYRSLSQVSITTAGSANDDAVAAIIGPDTAFESYSLWRKDRVPGGGSTLSSVETAVSSAPDIIHKSEGTEVTVRRKR